jgi:hypothetical protein
MREENRDMNRDPITKEPGSHPVGTAVGSAGAAAAGAAIGAPFGPIGMLIGGAIGAVAGGAAGHAAGEAIDPTGETEYWKHEYTTRPYYDKSRTWDDYEPAYRYGWESRGRFRDRQWDDKMENDLKSGWETAKGKSAMTWDHAKDAVRDSWNRTDRTYKTYETSDSSWRNHYQSSNYFDKSSDYDRDYRPAYRYGAFSRHRYGDRAWDNNLENDLARDWDRTKGASRLGWDKAKLAAKDAWHGVERAMPGDADKDGR